MGKEQFRHHDYGLVKEIRADISFISFYYDEKLEEWGIEELESHVPGLGRQLIREFIAKVGPNQKVHAYVIEEETRSKLEELGILDKVRETQQPEVIVDDEILNQLKIVRVFRAGGLKVDSVLLVYAGVSEEMYDVSVRVQATT